MFFSRETRWVPRGEQEVPALPVIFVGLELGSFYSICSFLCDILSTIMFFSWSLHRLSAFFFTIAPSVRLFFGHCIVCPPLLAIASSVRLLVVIASSVRLQFTTSNDYIFDIIKLFFSVSLYLFRINWSLLEHLTPCCGNVEGWWRHYTSHNMRSQHVWVRANVLFAAFQITYG